MKHWITALLLFISSNFVFGQYKVLTDDELNNSNVTKITFLTDCKNGINVLWQDDHSKKHVFLFLQGGIAPVYYAGDKDFEKKFHVHFYDYGCETPNYECIAKYNEKTFDYLNNVYGKRWQKKVRKDVIGLKNWKRKKK